MKRLTPAALAASIRLSVPCRSTAGTVSSPPRCVAVAVVMTVSTPATAASSDARSLRSP